MFEHNSKRLNPCGHRFHHHCINVRAFYWRFILFFNTHITLLPHLSKFQPGESKSFGLCVFILASRHLSQNRLAFSYGLLGVNAQYVEYASWCTFCRSGCIPTEELATPAPCAGFTSLGWAFQLLTYHRLYVNRVPHLIIEFLSGGWVSWLGSQPP